jgi:hypothetical protein
MAKKTETNNEFFEELKAGLNAAIEHAQGRRKDLRTTTLPRPPKALSAKEHRQSAHPTQCLVSRVYQVFEYLDKNRSTLGTRPRKTKRRKSEAAVDRKEESENSPGDVIIRRHPEEKANPGAAFDGMCMGMRANSPCVRRAQH